MGMFDDILAEPAPKGGGGLFDDIINSPNNEKSSVISDVAKSGAAGVARGAIGLTGILGDIQDASRWAGRKMGFEPPKRPLVEFSNSQERIDQANEMLAGPQSLSGLVTGEKPKSFLDYKPETTAGEYARTVGEFLPASVIGPGGAVKNALRFGVAPGIASEAAGQATKGTAMEPWARVAAGIGAGGLGAIASRPNVAERYVADAARGMTQQDIAEMERIFQSGLSEGLPLTRGEASGNSRLLDLQRIAEGQGGLREFMAQRPAQVEAAGRGAIEQIAPVPAQPSIIGPQVQEAAQGTISDVQGAINRHTRPFYQAAETQSVGPPAAALAANEPIYAQTLQEIRNNPALNRPIANLPDDSPVVMDMVRQRLNERAQAATSIGQATPSNLEAASYGAVERQAGQQSTAASPELAAARAQQAQLRTQYLDPLMAGPIGKLANRPDTKQAIEALFPRNPVPNSAPEVLSAVQALSARNPWAARQLVRAHVESVFNNATRDLQAGANQFGGASFRSQLIGNAQQAENLAAGIRGLPGGDAILPGFDRMLEVMEATGQRQRIGSQTAFNQELQAGLKTGGAVGEAAALAAGAGTKLPARVLERFQQWNIGRNVDQISRLLTEPDAAAAFRALASAPSGSSKAAAAMTRLVLISEISSQKRDAKK